MNRTISQVGSKKEKHFSLPKLKLPNMNWQFAFGYSSALASIGGDIIRLGRSVESLGQSAPVRDSTTRPTVKEA
jgi:hypothetical protein